jgi:hypothetical protein
MHTMCDGSKVARARANESIHDSCVIYVFAFRLNRADRRLSLQ